MKRLGTLLALGLACVGVSAARGIDRAPGSRRSAWRWSPGSSRRGRRVRGGGQGGGTGVLINAEGYRPDQFPRRAADRAHHAVRPGRRRPLRRACWSARQGRRRGPHQAAAQEGGAAVSDCRPGRFATWCSEGDWSIAMGNPVPAGHRFHADRDLRPGLAACTAISRRPASSWNTPIAFRSTPRSIPATPAGRSST